MKNLSLFVSVFALCASTSYAAINCNTLPTCESLGYTDIVAQCPQKSIKCPFDTAKGTCLHEAAVGEIAYFAVKPGAGWLLCNGQTISKAMYPDLYDHIGDGFCSSYHGGTCGTGVRRVPDYRGYFLRVSGTPNSTYGKTGNTNLIVPQKEGLPNITGWVGGIPVEYNQNLVADGAFYPDNNHSLTNNDYWFKEDNDWQSKGFSFSASRSNSLYGAQSGVTPPNIAVYAYIYAGKIVK